MRAPSRRSCAPPRRRCARSCRSSGWSTRAGARITDQVELFPGRRGAGRIFHNQVALSGKVPQICCLFGPSAAGGAYIPAFCDVVIMVEGNASMYLGRPRMAEMVVGEKVSLEEMGGARMHCTVSGCGDNSGPRRRRGDRAGPALLLLPARAAGGDAAADYAAEPPAPADPGRRCPSTRASPFDIHEVIDGLVDADTLLRGQAAVRGRAGRRVRRASTGESVGIVANNPRVKGGVLFGDSADKAARFIWLCDAFNVPLVYLADVPGLHDRHARSSGGGIIRHGAKMITAVVARPPCRRSAWSCARPTAPGCTRWAARASGRTPPSRCPPPRIAVMGPEAAVNAVYANKIDAIDGRRRAGRVRRRPPRGVRGGRRPAAPGQRPGDRRRDRARRAAPRAGPPPRLRRLPRPHPAPKRHDVPPV